MRRVPFAISCGGQTNWRGPQGPRRACRRRVVRANVVLALHHAVVDVEHGRRPDRRRVRAGACGTGFCQRPHRPVEGNWKGDMTTTNRVASHDALEFDPFSVTYFNDPYDTYRRLRDEAPAYYN